MNKRHLLHAAVYLLFEEDDRFLLIRRHKTGYRDGEYTLPARHVEADETMFDTCMREAKEEVCVDVKPSDLNLIHIMQRKEKDVNFIDFYFKVATWKGTPKIGEPSKADDLRWLLPSEVRDKTIHYVTQALGHRIDGTFFSHNGLQ